MDLSHSLTSSSDNETRALNTLLDVFGCAFSLDDIADAYIKAKGDVNKAGDFLTDLQLSLPHISDVEPSVETNLSQTGKAVEENYTENSSQPRTLSQIEKAVDEKHMENSDQTRMPEKLQKSSAAFGTVSSMLGKESARATTTVNRSSKKDKPVKVELPEYMRDDFKVKSDESDSAPRRETLNNGDIEEFLFCMLGEGFKLSMEVIREVLGSCGYDIKKSMEELMSFSEKGLDKKAQSKHNAIQDVAVECSVSKGKSLGSKSTLSTHSSQEGKGMQSSKSQISPGELIEAIFTVPGRFEEEPKLKRYELGANRSRVPDQKPVLKPLEDLSTYSTDFPIKVIVGSKEPAVNEEDYQNYRRAAKQHWDMMKQYYEKAADAFRVGNKKEVDYLIQEVSITLLFWKTESINEVCLDLRKQDAANVPNLLRFHLKQLSNIPSIDYLKVIIGVDDGSFKMGQRRRKVLKYLEKNSIQWTEEDPHSGNILIRINQVGNQHG
ncbi:putative nuclear RNA export factor SDE5 [Dichanthelium oligosanthes]|uniref:Putative nuclear RNA export factor SDE5 n=1 Tax=Dichanthelium oligosanthes TaxID=888268 RepID=A0A1E5UXG9_9POAL|nr:putative nuclear RNA export factor SDE5 [Dichanthelium oligosanthes]